MKDNQRFREERRQMVTEQLVPRGITDPRVLAVMERIPRHHFVPPAYQHLAYVDGPLPIGEGQTISQPYMVALMSSLLELTGDEVVLEVGTGSGYQAAVLSGLAAQVFTIERHPPLVKNARKRFADLGIENITVIEGDGSLGYPEQAPYQGVLVTAAAPKVPQPLFDQLADGGRLVLPVGGVLGQNLLVWTRLGERFDSRSVAPVAFVPLRGEHGWSEGEWGES
jgi:protein-L-isoaspartate(D-aspartate) O-methyltransferase